MAAEKFMELSEAGELLAQSIADLHVHIEQVHGNCSECLNRASTLLKAIGYWVTNAPIEQLK